MFYEAGANKMNRARIVKGCPLRGWPDMRIQKESGHYPACGNCRAGGCRYVGLNNVYWNDGVHNPFTGEEYDSPMLAGIVLGANRKCV